MGFDLFLGYTDARYIKIPAFKKIRYIIYPSPGDANPPQLIVSGRQPDMIKRKGRIPHSRPAKGDYSAVAACL